MIQTDHFIWHKSKSAERRENMENKKRLRIIASMIVPVFIFAGCASIVSKSNWPVNIRSTPDQADVTVTDVKEGKEVFKGKTPTIVTLNSKGGYFKGKAYTVKVSKEGFDPQTIEIKSVLNGWFVGNIVFGGLIGILIVDPLTGAMWRLSPREVDFAFPPKTSELSSDERGVSIVFLQDVPEQLRDKMIRIR